MKIVKEITNILKSIDIFAFNVGNLFHFKGEQYYGNVWSKCFTIMVICGSISTFMILSLEFFRKTSPYVVMYESYFENKDPLFMSKNGFLAIFGIRLHNGTHLFDESIYKPEACIYTKNGSNTSCDPLSLGRCEAADIPESMMNSAVFENNNYSNMYCFKNLSSVQFMGFLDSKSFKVLNLSINPCTETKDLACASKDAINQTFLGSYFIMNYASSNLDPYDFERPLKTDVSQYFMPLLFKKTTQMFLNFGTITVRSQTFFNVPDEMGVFFQSEKYSSVEVSNPFASPIFRTFIQLDKTQKIVTRRYVMIQDVLSKLGGLIQIYLIISQILLKGFVRRAFLQRVSNEILDYDDYKKQAKIQSHMRKIKMSFWEFIKHDYFPCLRRGSKDEVLKLAQEYMEKELDIAKIMNKMNEVEKIKFVLYDDQLNQIETLPNQKILFNKSEIHFPGQNIRKANIYKKFFVQKEKRIGSFQRKIMHHVELLANKNEVEDGKINKEPSKVSKAITLSSPNSSNERRFFSEKESFDVFVQKTSRTNTQQKSNFARHEQLKSQNDPKCLHAEFFRDKNCIMTEIRMIKKKQENLIQEEQTDGSEKLSIEKKLIINKNKKNFA